MVPRGAGTSLSGGALPLADGVLLGLSKFNRILDIDYDNRCVVAQPGVTNLGITNAVEAAGFYYAPDPSSQIACTIGGNVAENSGGVHCLKYGLTTNNVLGCRAGADERRGRPPRRQGARLRRLRSARPRHRLGGPARRRHRGDGAHPARSRRPRRRCCSAFPPSEAAGECVAQHHRRRHHPGRHGDDGPPGDPRGRGLRRTPAIRSTSRPC